MKLRRYSGKFRGYFSTGRIFKRKICLCFLYQRMVVLDSVFFHVKKFICLPNVPGLLLPVYESKIVVVIRVWPNQLNPEFELEDYFLLFCIKIPNC
jgi:hypothetical protein